MTQPTSAHTAQWAETEQSAAEVLIAAALQEDLNGQQDVTSTTLIPADLRADVQIVARKPGRICGVAIGRDVLASVDAEAVWTAHVEDGSAVKAGTVIATLEGRVRCLLTAERTILNFMTHLSGIATLTQQFVEAVQGTQAQIFDTRKTLPGWRLLQKYAVRCGGGTNHRMGLWDAVLIKDNHLAALAEEGVTSLRDVVRLARERAPAGTPVIIEVDTLEQLTDALEGAPDVVLLDNMDVETLCEAVQLRDASSSQALLEASGGVTLRSVTEIAKAGVDRISIGALTHSVPALDIGFDWPV